MKKAIAVLTLLALVVAPSAFAAGKGTSILSLGLGQGKANIPIVSPIVNQMDETNVGAQYWHLFSDDYAFTVAGTFGFGSTKIEDTALNEETKLSLTSTYQFRIGGDRVANVGDRLMVYMGPGITFASAKAKIEQTGSPDEESERAKTFGINGRIGGIMMLSDAVGIAGEINHTFGRTSYEDSAMDLKVTSWPNSVGAFWALTFLFGGS